MSHRSCMLSCMGFYTKLYTKSAISESSIALARLNLAHLFSMLLAKKFYLRILNFVQGLSYGLSKSKKWGKSSLNFEGS